MSNTVSQFLDTFLSHVVQSPPMIDGKVKSEMPTLQAQPKYNFLFSIILVLFLLTLNLSCQNENVISSRILGARLLHDEQETQAYLEEFPKAQYKVYQIPGVGQFYLDEVKDVIKNRLRKGKVWEESVVAALKEYVKPDTTVIDGGAYIGTHTVLMSKCVGKKGRVYAFEPQRKIYRELVYNLELNQIKNAVPLRFALGSDSRIVEMSPTRQGNEGGTRVGSGGDKVELRTIDSFGFRNVSLIKIDVEGYEKYVIEGARKTIQKYHPVLIVEIGGGVNYEKAPRSIKARIDRVKDKIVKLGYFLLKLDRHNYLAKPLNPGCAK